MVTHNWSSFIAARYISIVLGSTGIFQNCFIILSKALWHTLHKTMKLCKSLVPPAQCGLIWQSCKSTNVLHFWHLGMSSNKYLRSPLLLTKYESIALFRYSLLYSLIFSRLRLLYAALRYNLEHLCEQYFQPFLSVISIPHLKQLSNFCSLSISGFIGCIITLYHPPLKMSRGTTPPLCYSILTPYNRKNSKNMTKVGEC